MFTKDNILNGNISIGGVATKVKDHLHRCGIYTGSIKHGKGEFFISLDIAALGKQEVAVIPGVGKLEGHLIHILTKLYLALEVVCLLCTQGNSVIGDNEELVLPLVRGGFRTREAVR